MNRRSFLGLLAAAPVAQRLPLLGELEAAAQIERRGELHPLVGPYNYALKKNYSTVYRYLDAVDIGHAQLAEVLLTTRDEERAIHRIEHDTWDMVREMFLDPRKAPRLAPAEETIAPESTKVAWRLNQAFDWTHILHRQIYDILATDFPADRKHKYILEAYAWYRSEPRRAFPPKLKTHDLMEHQWFSQYWREKNPRVNRRLLGYHLDQVRPYQVMLQRDQPPRDVPPAAVTA